MQLAEFQLPKFGGLKGGWSMNAEDRKRLKSGGFDREAWAALWDRLHERMRRSTVEFVLQKLHAIESGGRWSFSWHYETSEQREESGAPIFEDDQPGDVITCKGSLQIGNQPSSQV